MIEEEVLGDIHRMINMVIAPSEELQKHPDFKTIIETAKNKLSKQYCPALLAEVIELRNVDIEKASAPPEDLTV